MSGVSQGATLSSVPEFLQRMFVEHTQLESRLLKLQDFLGQGHPKTLDALGADFVELAALTEQLYAMEAYLRILKTRIERAKAKHGLD